MWSIVNQSLNTVFDLYLWPFHRLSDTWQACALALPAAVLALLVYRYASNQVRIQKTKDKIKAHLLEQLLFKDDMRMLIRAQGQILRFTLIYMRLAIVPMAVMIVPFIFFIIQVESRFAFHSLEPGEATVLSVAMNHADPVSAVAVSLSLPMALVQETPALRIDSTGEIFWRIRAVTAGEYRIGIMIGEEKLEKRAVIANNNRPVSPKVYRASDIRSLAYPAEPALESNAGAVAIRLDYPRGRSAFAGLSSASWMFLGMSLLIGFVLRGLFGVTF